MHMHSFPSLGTHSPQVQAALHTRLPHGSLFTQLVFAPGSQTACTPEQLDHAPKAPH